MKMILSALVMLFLAPISQADFSDDAADKAVKCTAESFPGYTFLIDANRTRISMINDMGFPEEFEINARPHSDGDTYITYRGENPKGWAEFTFSDDEGNYFQTKEDFIPLNCEAQ